MPKNPNQHILQDVDSIKVLETFAGAILWLDEKGTIMHVSETLLSLLKVSKGTIDGKKWASIDKEIAAHSFDQIWDKLCTDHTLDWHTTLQIGKTQEYKVLVEARIVQNDLCEFACLRISAISKPDSLLGLINTLTKSLKSAAWKWDLNNGVFSITDSFYKLFELPETRKIEGSTNIIKLLQPFLTNHQSEELKNAILELRKSRGDLEYDWTPLINDVHRKMRLKAFPVIENNITVAINGTVSLVELSLRKDRLNKLASTVLEQSTSIALILNEKLNVVYANETACLELDISDDKFDDNFSILQIDIEKTSNQWDKQLETLRSKKHLETVTSFQRSNATIFPVELTITYFKDYYGELVCILAKDISENRKKVSILKADLAEKTSITKQLEDRASYLQSENSKNFKLGNIISVSKKYQPILSKIKQVAPTVSTVLIEGETGTGKELVARAIHELSARSNRIMVKVNCANLPKELIESELFGHEKGAFTGAIQQKKGRFELADKGTLFLDEIGEMPLEMQTRLLRVLQEGEFERVGGNKTIRVDARIIAATNRNLKDLVAEKKFREDLYFRLHVFPIYNIPLRDRKEDIKPLAYHFLEKFNKKMNKLIIQDISQDDLKRLTTYDFPGNIRELENIIERSVILSTGKFLALDFWQPETSNKFSTTDNFLSFDEMQKNYITEALEITKWKISGINGAAQLLGMNDQTLFSKMRKFGISRN